MYPTLKSAFSLAVLLFLAISCTKTGNIHNRRQVTSYYVSNFGNDSGPGSIEAPWRTVNRVNSTDLNAGDTVFFMGGQIFEGTLAFDSLDSGKKDFNIVITSYGQGKAIINGGTSRALYVRECNNFMIRKLEFRGDGRKGGNQSDGVLIENSNNILVDDIEVYGFQHSGLLIYGGNIIRITNVYAHDNGFAGIHVSSAVVNDPVNYGNNDLYIGNCRAENNPGDPTVLENHSGNGILVSSVNGGVIEYCIASGNGWDMPWDGNGPVGIWIWDCTNFIIQHCISHSNKTHPGARDGGGFDLDGGVSNSIIQYCLSYNNAGTGIGLYEFGANKPWKNNTVRYNISQNDGVEHDGSLGVWKAGAGNMQNCDVYNNTFYNSNTHGNILWLDSSMPGLKFRNNIFIYTGKLLFKGQSFKKEIFQGNLYWNLSGGFEAGGYDNLPEWSEATGNELVGKIIAGLNQDPLLVAPGTAVLTDPSELRHHSFKAYDAGIGSPVIDKGLNMQKQFGINTGGTDFFGTPLPQGKGFDIGAVENIY